LTELSYYSNLLWQRQEKKVNLKEIGLT